MINKRTKDLKIYLLLAVLLIVGSGMGLDVGQKVILNCDQTEEAVLKSQSLISCSGLHTLAVKDNTSVVLGLRSLRNSRGDSFCRCGLFFLYILASLSGVFRLVQKTYTFYSRLYIWERFHIITFMQDTDGRKKFS
ncbi:MAG: hypothetical protein HFJ06_13070 [Lachnospiraceae bacterium]|nr:hypothetical protein [Lachnospiraceae bacterium]